MAELDAETLVSLVVTVERTMAGMKKGGSGRERERMGAWWAGCAYLEMDLLQMGQAGFEARFVPVEAIDARMVWGSHIAIHGGTRLSCPWRLGDVVPVRVGVSKMIEVRTRCGSQLH